MRKIVATAVGFVCFYNLFLYHTWMGIGTGVLFLVLNLMFFLLKNSASKNILLGIMFSLLSTIFAFLSAYSANFFIQALDIHVAITLSMCSLFLYKNSERFTLSFPSFFFLPFAVVKDTLQSFFLPETKEYLPKTSPEVLNSLVKGVIIAMPVIAILFFLLMQADPVFAHFAHKFLDTLGERVIISLIIFVLIGLIGISKSLTSFYELPEVKKALTGKSHELLIIGGSIVALFALFITIQLRYLFSTIGETQLHELGISVQTFSEYVRKGFFELLIAASIASAIILYLLRYIHHFVGKQKLLLQGLSGLLTIETGLLLLSAVKRLAMYADAHGLTRARIFGYVFLLWLGVMLIIFLIRIVKNIRRDIFFAMAFAVTILMIFLINMVNVDKKIATKYRPTVNHEVDYFYLANLSADGYQGWQNAVIDAQKLAKELEKKPALTPEDNRKLSWAIMTISEVRYQVNSLVDKYGSAEQIIHAHQDENGGWVDVIKKEKQVSSLPEPLQDMRKWESRNMSEYAAFHALTSNTHFLTDVYILWQRLQSIQNTVNDQTKADTQMDRSTNPPFTR